jgi:hypothetical protein
MDCTELINESDRRLCDELEKDLERARKEGPGLLNKICRDIVMLPGCQRQQFSDMHGDELIEIGIV